MTSISNIPSASKSATETPSIFLTSHPSLTSTTPAATDPKASLRHIRTPSPLDTPRVEHDNIHTTITVKITNSNNCAARAAESHVLGHGAEGAGLDRELGRRATGADAAAREEPRRRRRRPGDDQGRQGEAHDERREGAEGAVAMRGGAHRLGGRL